MTTISPNKVFRDPYADEPEDKKSRFMSMVPTSDYEFLRSIRPTSRPYQGTIQTIANYFFQWLIHELKQRNITSFSKSRELEQFIIDEFAIIDSTDRGPTTGAKDKNNIQPNGPVNDTQSSAPNTPAPNRRTNSKGAKSQ